MATNFSSRVIVYLSLIFVHIVLDHYQAGKHIEGNNQKIMKYNVFKHLSYLQIIVGGFKIFFSELCDRIVL